MEKYMGFFVLLGLCAFFRDFNFAIKLLGFILCLPFLVILFLTPLGWIALLLFLIAKIGIAFLRDS